MRPNSNSKRKALKELIDACNAAIEKIPRHNVCEIAYAPFRECLKTMISKASTLDDEFSLLAEEFKFIPDSIISTYPDDREWSQADILFWDDWLHKLLERAEEAFKPYRVTLGTAKLRGAY